MSLSSFRVHYGTNRTPGNASTEKVTNTHRRAGAVGYRCHRSACTKTRPDSEVRAPTGKVTNTHRAARTGRMSLSSFACARRDRTAE
ncbi:hypothetical protein TNCV_3695861 [Trichonephila clavipes]|nr:hypothetical protein TNCV_3695861 [Trichonephila clavipes]